MKELLIVDVASMYPSMIREYQLCKSTLIEKRFLSTTEWNELQQNWRFREYTLPGPCREIIVVDGRIDEKN